MSQKEKLLPCPFCGGEAIMERTVKHNIIGVQWHGHCTTCGSNGQRYVSRRYAEAAWNTRTTPPADKDVVERVARAICKADMVLPDEYGVAGKPRWTQYERKARAAIAAMPNYAAGLSRRLESGQKVDDAESVLLDIHERACWHSKGGVSASFISDARDVLSRIPTYAEGIRKGLEMAEKTCISVESRWSEYEKDDGGYGDSFASLGATGCVKAIRALIEKEG